MDQIRAEQTLRVLLWNLWSDILTDQDREVIIEAGYEARRPTLWDSWEAGDHLGLLILDMRKMFIVHNGPTSGRGAEVC